MCHGDNGRCYLFLGGGLELGLMGEFNSEGFLGKGLAGL